MPYHEEPIAIIGSGCRFPGESNSISNLWKLLAQPRDVLSKIPATRFDPRGFYHKDGTHHGSMNVQHAYLISDDFRRFDAQFFHIKPLEAVAIDPQQRLLLETVYETIESAGQSLEKLQGSDTAVYVGAMSVDYADNGLLDMDSMPQYHSTGTARAILSNRISYFFDWHGPSATVDTACSSSIVALHQAIQALQNGDSRMAIAAGANLLIGPGEWFSQEISS
jgi:hybrid polyketide synthase/nonribosomal peptide synthetase ACE1